MTASAATLAYAPNLSSSEQKGVSECSHQPNHKEFPNSSPSNSNRCYFPVSYPENPNTNKEEA